MRILILGATGMIGHRLWIGLSPNHEVYGVIRRSKSELPSLPNICLDNIFDKVNVLNFDLVEKIIKKVQPDLVFNCIGVVKQLQISKNYIDSIELNSLLPHKLAKLCLKYRSRMIQFSSDCVFDGKKGSYIEENLPNALDLYGKSKALGEVIDMENVLTLRTSFIGREIFPHGGLIDWFEAQKEKTIKGFSRAIYSGLPTNYFIKILNEYILPNNKLHGMYHLAGVPIDKYSLLIKAREALNLEIEIEIKKDDDFIIDRSLDCSKFSKKTGYIAPEWNEVINELNVDSDFYATLKGG